ncbi:MAG: (2Fe-2S)-binding protein [Acidimicrobiaceae bacterium]|nr:(2Fe-2S)-binding protein [Acidimicrobiaceae bacterium]
MHHGGARSSTAPGSPTSMIVCQCLATNEAAIRRLAAHGGTTVRDVSMACGAGTDCGSCVAMIQAVLDQCVLEAIDPAHHPVHSIAFEAIAVGA